MNIIPLVKKELLEIYRSKKLLILAILFLFIAISSPILAKLIPTILKSMPETPGLTIQLPEPTWKDAVDQLIKNLSQIGMVVLIILSAGSIAEEKNKKTLEIVLTKPISRSKFILVKFISSLFVTKVVFLISMLIFYLYTISLFGSFSLLNFIWLTIFSLIALAFMISLTVFFSAISKNQIIALALAFATEAILAIIFSSIKKISDYNPSYVFGNYKELMSNDQIHDFIPSALVSIGAIVLLLVFAILSFKKQEIER